MKSRDAKRLTEQVRQLSPDVILKATGLCDGHSIMKPEAFTDAGLPAEVVKHLTHTYKSDGSPKGTIFVKGKPVKELSGVYGLDMLRFIASALGVEYRQAMGRGFEAQNIQIALRQHFASTTSPDLTAGNAPATTT
jgi:acyl CoA:acetate/3-ketoacid CoA transferase